MSKPSGPEWKRVKAIASEAWARPASERAAYVTTACADDEALAREVMSLVRSMAAAEDRFESPPRILAANLPDVLGAGFAGRSVGPYEILSLIGAGGMGDVYKAHDTRLDRIVAIKVFTARATIDPASRERIAREARAVAALNHPHICTLYDIGSQDGLDFLVMEFLDGETLAARLARGALPMTETLLYADQIASALVEAHRAGIVHRDVKPGNIMLTRTGIGSTGLPQAKLLDFGLAKVHPLEIQFDPTHPAPEAALDVTVPGFVVGTVQYMAPEQFERNANDARTDIFAFGTVLYEMLTGRKAFEGANRDEVLRAILDEERPRVSSHRPRVPSELDRLVTKCLSRNPDKRYQSVHDLVADLRAVRRRLDSSSRVRKFALAAAVPVLVIGGAAAWVALAGRDVAPTAAPSVTRLAASAGVVGAAALSPDGSNLVFSWVGDDVDNPELVLLRIGSTSRVRLTSDPGVEEWPAWSPDGTRIAFVRCAPGRCGIFTVPAGGGPERKLLDLRDHPYYWLAWSPDGRSIAFAEHPSPGRPNALFLLSLDGLVTRRLTTPPPGGGELRFAFSPDSKMLAVIRLGEGTGVHLVSVETGSDTALLSGQQEWFGGVAWSGDGRHLILSANQQGVRRLWKLPVAGGGLEQLAVAGENAFYPSVSWRAGRLAFVHEFRDWDFARMALDQGNARASSSFPSSTRIDLDPAFSPDGRKLAFLSERGGSREVWVSNPDGSEARQLTFFNGAAAGRPSWSPDGQFLAFQWYGINVMAAGGGPARKLSNDGERPTWSSDGRWIYFMRNQSGQFCVWKVPAAGGSAVQAITREASIAHEGPHGDVYFASATVDGGIWRRPADGGPETRVIQDLKPSLPGYWTVFKDGIYYVAEERERDQTVANQLKFFDFASRRTTRLGTLTGPLDDWAGGLTISPDRRILLYSHRTYESREVLLVEHFR